MARSPGLSNTSASRAPANPEAGPLCFVLLDGSAVDLAVVPAQRGRRSCSRWSPRGLLAAQRSIADAPFYQINPSAVFQSFRAGGRALPLAADRTTPLALHASQGRIPAQVIRGLIAGDFGPEVELGRYMLRPYASGKIPVLFVDGLALSPLAFL
jgi:hypothetical protein